MEIIENYKGFEIVNSNKIDGWFMTKCESVCGQSVSEVKQDLDSMLIERNKGNKVTAYYMGSFGMGVIKMEGKLLNMGTEEWAQYKNSPFLSIIPAGKRKARRYRQTSFPYMVVLEGVGHPNPEDQYNVLSSTEGMTVKQCRHMSFDDAWKNEADDLLDNYIKESGAVVIGDYRESKGFSPYSGRALSKVERVEKGILSY